MVNVFSVVVLWGGVMNKFLISISAAALLLSLGSAANAVVVIASSPGPISPSAGTTDITFDESGWTAVPYLTQPAGDEFQYRHHELRSAEELSSTMAGQDSAGLYAMPANSSVPYVDTTNLHGDPCQSIGDDNLQFLAKELSGSCWGSIDTYNTIQFFNNGSNATSLIHGDHLGVPIMRTAIRARLSPIIHHIHKSDFR